jgi:hypothetical protein
MIQQPRNQSFIDSPLYFSEQLGIPVLPSYGLSIFDWLAPALRKFFGKGIGFRACDRIFQGSDDFTCLMIRDEDCRHAYNPLLVRIDLPLLAALYYPNQIPDAPPPQTVSDKQACSRPEIDALHVMANDQMGAAIM